MNSHRLTFAAGLLAVLALTGTPAARACKYCWSAENADAAEYARQAMQSAAAPPSQPSGAFPLDGAISQFQPAAPATLAAPPDASTVVTSGADLRAARAATTTLPPVPPVSTPKVAATITPRPATPHYADAGLLGLAAVGGVFCWRTRRKTGPVR